MSNRNELGRFHLKGEQPRSVRSIRTTDNIWERMGEIAKENDINRADLLEKMIEREDITELPLLKEIDKMMIEKIEKLIEGLERNGSNDLKIQSKDKSAARRTLQLLVEYLK